MSRGKILQLPFIWIYIFWKIESATAHMHWIWIWLYYKCQLCQDNGGNIKYAK